MHTYICVIWLGGHEKRNKERLKKERRERNITSVNDV